MPEKPSAEDIQPRIESGAVIVVHFTAEWCEPCKDLDAALDQLRGSFPSVQFLSVCMRRKAQKDEILKVKVT